MTITLFLLLCLVAMPGLWLLGRQKGMRKWNGFQTRDLLLAAAWTGLGLAGIATINSYTHPGNPDRFFPNTAYHLLEHEGFAFRDSLQLVNEAHPEKALWDGESGEMTARSSGDQVMLRWRGFKTPLFIEEEGKYVLANTEAGLPVKGEILVWRSKDTEIRLRIEEAADTAAYQFDINGRKYASVFNTVLSRGYPLVDIFRKTPGADQFPIAAQGMEGSLLVRGTHGDTGSALYLFHPQSTPAAAEKSASKSEEKPASPAPRGGKATLAPGQSFFTGIGLDKGPKYHFHPGPRHTQLNYDFPKRHQLPEAPDNDLFICSNFSDVAQNAVQGGYFYPLFTSPDNQYHLNGGLRFKSDDARTVLQMRVTDHQAPGQKKGSLVKGGETFELYARDGATRWRFRLANLRAEHPISAWHLRGFVLLFVVLVVLTLQGIGGKRRKPFEPVLFLLVFAFLTVRIVLQWRMGAFPPVEEVTPSEWDFLRSGRHFWITVVVTGLFFVLRWVLYAADLEEGLLADLKEKGLKLSDSLRGSGPVKWLLDGLEDERSHHFVLRYLLLFVVGWLLLAIPRLLGIEQVERFLNIAYPVAFFLLFQSHLLKAHSDPRSLVFAGINPFRLFNALFTAGYLAAADAGFAIIFLLFLALWDALMALYDKGGRKNKRPLGKAGAFVQLVAPLVLMVLFGDDFMQLLFGHPVWVYWLLAVPLGAVAAWYFGGVVLRDLGKGGPVPQVICAVGMAVLLAVASPLGVNKIESLSYVKYRAAIHQDNLDEIIADERFDSGQMGQILRAAQNQWFINNYLRDQDKSGAFRLQPHFNKGSSFTTQTTDLVVTRYIIAEHNSLVLFLLLALLLATATLYPFTYHLKKSQLTTPFGALLLLSAIAFFIWLTATNRFVFFGQDFPLISLTSLFTLVFSLGLLLFALVKGQDQKPRSSLPPTPAIGGFAVLFVLGFLALVHNRQIDEDNFDFNVSLDQARSDFDRLDEEFMAFQDTFAAEVPVDSLVSAFYHNMPDSLVSVQPFSQSVFEHFVKDQEVKTNPEELLHLVNRNGRYRFALNRSYYLIRPPQEQRNEWRGNLYAADEGSGAFLLDLGDRSRRFRIPVKTAVPQFEARLGKGLEGVNMAVLPSTWTADRQPAVLLWSAGTNEDQAAFTLTNSQTGGSQYSQEFVHPTLRLQANDFITIPGKGEQQLRFQYLEDFQYYLAKNIWLNGEQRLFYPLGDRLLWAYYYANAVKSAYGTAEERDRDQHVSLDFALTDALSQLAKRHFEKNKWERQRFGIVALNGDGQLRALVDHQPERIDPNDIREFNEKNREYYLRNNNRLERETFGNINLLKLPNGPGSTLKPIMYSAVTSQYRLNWPGLELAPVPADVLEVTRDAEEEKILWYGGKRINQKWSGIGEADLYQITPRDYIVRSKNLYHSAVMFLGSYSKEEIAAKLNFKILLPPRQDSLELNFPLLRYGGQLRRFNPLAWPRSEANGKSYFGNKRSLLALGLYDNFDLPTFRPRDKFPSRHQNIDPLGADIFGRSSRGHVLYGYPEQAHFYQENRISNGPLWFIRGLKQVAAGGDPVRVTPLKMAEMAGKLYSFNRNFEVSLSDSVAPKAAAPLVVDESWDGQYLDFVQEYLYGSMQEVVLRGTASSLGRRLRNWKSDYFYYAKTGTIKNADDESSLEDKLFMLVISKGNVREMTPDELRNNKFYVVYLTGWEMGVTPEAPRWELFFDVIQTIESSYLFKSYMNGTEEET